MAELAQQTVTKQENSTSPKAHTVYDLKDTEKFVLTGALLSTSQTQIERVSKNVLAEGITPPEEKQSQNIESKVVIGQGIKGVNLSEETNKTLEALKSKIQSNRADALTEYAKFADGQLFEKAAEKAPDSKSKINGVKDAFHNIFNKENAKATLKQISESLIQAQVVEKEAPKNKHEGAPYIASQTGVSAAKAAEIAASKKQEGIAS